MKNVVATAVILISLGGCASSPSQPVTTQYDGLYRGTSKVTSNGYGTFHPCHPGNVRLTIAGGHFSLPSITLAPYEGYVASDGKLYASIDSAVGTSRFNAQVTDNKLVGTISNHDCAWDIEMTKVK